MILFPALALDLELSRRVGERGLNPCGFLIANFLGQTNLGAPAGFLGLRLVNVLGTDGHVGENGDAISGDLHEAIANREEKSFLAFVHNDFACDELCHQRHVLW